MLFNHSLNGVEFSAYSPSTNGDGVITYTVSSDYIGAATSTCRVLLPSGPSNVNHRVIIALPVELDPQTNYGSGLDCLRTNNAQNAYNATIVEPQFGNLTWCADNPLNTDYRHETFIIIGLVPWIRTNFSGANDPISLIGFSKSGFGAMNLILRYPTMFTRAACWDFPVDMVGYNQYEGSTAAYGSQGNFNANYKLSTARLNAARVPFLGQEKLWFSANRCIWDEETLTYCSTLSSLGILYTLDDPNSLIGRTHWWLGGWVPIAAQWLGTDIPLPSQRLGRWIRTTP